MQPPSLDDTQEHTNISSGLTDHETLQIDSRNTVLAKPRLQPIEKPIASSSLRSAEASPGSTPSEAQKQHPLANSIISVLDLPK